MTKFWNKYKHAIPIFAYMAIYLTWFAILEKKVTTYRIIHTAADDLIPFCEFFVIPYFTWFVYMFACVGIAFYKDLNEFKVQTHIRNIPINSYEDKEITREQYEYIVTHFTPN